MDKKLNLIFISMFIGIIYIITIMNIVTPDREKSEVENRELQQFPTISDMKNGDFSQMMDSYCSDQFFIRDMLIKADIKWKIMTGKTEVNGHYIADEGWILGSPEKSEHSDEDINRWVEKIEELSSKKKDMDVYYFSTPHKVNTLDFMYSDFVDKKYGMINEKKLLQELESKGIKTVNAGEYFKSSFDEEELKKMYFKTDHHWNPIGAYNAFEYFIEEYSKENGLNIDINDEEYDIDWLKNKDFDGSYNRNLAYMFSKEEDIPIIKKKDTSYQYYKLENNEFKLCDENSIIGKGVNKRELSYEDVYTGNESCYKVVNNSAELNKKVVILRDSYEAAMSGMFSEVFKEVYVIDPRVTSMSMDEIIKKCNPDTLIFMFNNGAVLDDMLNYIK